MRCGLFPGQEEALAKRMAELRSDPRHPPGWDAARHPDPASEREWREMRLVRGGSQIPFHLLVQKRGRTE